MRREAVIQITGIGDQREADLCVACGATHLGFPLRLSVHEEDLTEEDAAVIIGRLVTPVRAVLITYLVRAEEIVSLARKIGTPIVQLHGDIDHTELTALRKKAPDLELWKSLVVGGTTSSDEIVRQGIMLRDLVDAFIMDTYDPEIGASGATGKTHDWRVSRRLAETSTKPVILAGGLTPKNVKQAILSVGPAGVDAHTGVEGPDGKKSRSLVETFVREASEGFCQRLENV